ncbi:cytochrome c [Novosphingobium flavum]|nr:cytochrome c [Novosphingobium aerophilum]
MSHKKEEASSAMLRIPFLVLLLAGASLTGAILTARASAADAPPSPMADAIIFERQEIMGQLRRDSDVLGDILAGVQPAERLPAVTAAIAQGARDSLDIYRQRIPGGRTRSEAWAEHEKFMGQMEAFARNTELMAKAGSKGDLAGVTALVVEALPCKQCHDRYRLPAKPS